MNNKNTQGFFVVEIQG